MLFARFVPVTSINVLMEQSVTNYWGKEKQCQEGKQTNTFPSRDYTVK